MNAIKDVELVSIGTHNGITFSESDLDEIVESTNKLDFDPAVKIGHSDDDSEPAYGYVKNFRKVGSGSLSKIVADFVDLTDEIYTAITEKRFGRVSIELYKNLKRGDNIFKRAIGAVALLGQAIPGMANLKPLYKMFGLEGESVVNFEADIISIHTDSEVSDMDKEKFEAEVAALTSKLNDAQSQLDLFKSKADSKDVIVSALQSKIFSMEVEKKVEKLPPSIKQYIQGLYTFAHDVKVEKFSLDKTEVTQTELIDKLSSFLTEKFSALFEEVSEKSTGGKKDETYATVADEVDAAVQKYMAENGEKDYRIAFSTVLSKDADLKTRYATEMEG